MLVKKLGFIMILAAIGVGLYSMKETLLSAMGQQAAPPASQSTAVKVVAEPVAMTPNNRIFEAVGTGRARLSADIYPAVAEEVTEVAFEAEQHVQKGDLLVQLDDREEKLAVRLAQVKLKDAKSLLARFEQAGKQGAVPQSEVDTARADFQSAQVALEQAQLALKDRQITAPFSGIVGIPNIDPGDRVTTQTLITGLDARDMLYIDFTVPEALAGALRAAQMKEQRITATTPSYPDRNFQGYITAQESRINTAQRTLMARANIDNDNDLLRPGMSFTTRWEIPGDSFATVPEISLQWGRDGSYVWIIRDRKAVQVPARVVARKAGRVLLDGEIREGEQIVVEGVQRLRPNISVEILRADTP